MSDRKYIFAATNPCHVWDQVKGLASIGKQVTFFTGYSQKRLSGSHAGIEFYEICVPTYVTYALTKLLGRSGSIARKLYYIQDRLFDRMVARSISRMESCDDIVFISLPGQSLRSMQAARAKGWGVVLNHASGPVEVQSNLVKIEAERMEVDYQESTAEIHPRSQILSERDGADVHLVSSKIVKEQFETLEIEAARIAVSPYGVDDAIFKKMDGRDALSRETFRVIFAGQTDLRKGIHWLLEAWVEGANTNWSLDIYGPDSAWFKSCMKGLEKAAENVHYHGSVDHSRLAREIGSSDVLVLSSVEDAFGLVVLQALQIGTPCVVSDRVGAKDLIASPDHGGVVEFGNSKALLAELRRLERERPFVSQQYGAREAAESLVEVLEESL